MCLTAIASCSQSKKSTDDLNYSINNDTYPNEWKTVDSLENKEGLPKSALAEVEKIYDKAIKDNNEAQQIKAIIYINKYTLRLEEDSQAKVIKFFESEIAKSDFPKKQILHSLLGEIYTQYLQNNYYKLRDRSYSTASSSPDINTWSARDFMAHANENYLTSIADQRLKDYPKEAYQAIIRQGSDKENLRPGLYDFLAHRAIDHFQVTRSFLDEPVNAFVMNDKAYFDEAEAFVNMNFEHPDNLSLKLQALKVFKNLLEVRLSEQGTHLDALIHADLKRLQFVNSHYVLGDKKDLYINALDQLFKKAESNNAKSDIQFLKASQYLENWNEGNDQKNPDLILARNLLNDILKKYPNTPAANKAHNQLLSIENKMLNIVTEKVQVPETNIKLNVRYKNIDKVFLKWIKLPDDAVFALRNLRSKDQIKYIKKGVDLASWSQAVPNPQDYNQHVVDIKSEPLSKGVYALAFDWNENIRLSENERNYLIVSVSDLAIIHENNYKASNQLFVVHRESGRPVSSASVKFYRNEYNSRKRVNELILDSTEQSDQDGKVKIPKNDRGNFTIELSKADDLLQFERGIYSRNHYGNQGVDRRVHFFTDRAIYRPNQTLHFKAYAIEKKFQSYGANILPNTSIEVSLLDANMQLISKQTLKTNAYGTCNGSFEIPDGRLLGNWSLQSQVINGNKQIKVEEYKRPKFEVNFDDQKEEASLNKMVKLSGEAKMYAGAALDGATYTYTITRKAYYPYRYHWYRSSSWYPYNSNAAIIDNGSGVLDKNGKFDLAFEAVPDLSIDKERDPSFMYTVEITVTDITGETHEKSKTIRLGYKSLLLSSDLPEQVSNEALDSILIQSTNLDGDFLAASGNITIEKLKSPDKSIRPRIGGIPDQFVMTREEHDRYFPYDVYKGEDRFENWEVDQEVLKQSFNTGKEKKVGLNRKLDAAVYKVTLKAKDKGGNDIESIQFVKMYDPVKMTIPGVQMLSDIVLDKSYEPGEAASILLAASESNAHVLYSVYKQTVNQEDSWLNLNKSSLQSISITEADRGGLGVQLNYVRHNRYYHQSILIAVPWSNKKLQTTWTTFRDQLLPGQQEEWRLKIAGPVGEKVGAEMLASMYDASLDAIVPHNWSWNLFSTFNHSANWMGLGFDQAQRSLYEQFNNYKDVNEAYFDQLNWFGFYMSGNTQALYGKTSGVTVRGSRTKVFKSSAPPPQAMESEVMMDADASFENNASGGAMDEMAEEESVEAVEEINEADQSVSIRTNLNETVFFYPEIHTDQDGNLELRFTMNEALTKWKLQTLTHTKSLQYAFQSEEIITQKDVMVFPNPPRFLREGDRMILSGKISNLADKAINGTAELKLLDAITDEDLSANYQLKNASIPFNILTSQSKEIAWEIDVPENMNALRFQMIAKAGKHSDGEENVIPVLSNRMMVTESLPLAVRSNETKDFTFEALASQNSKTLDHHKFTLEFSSNPVWYAVQAIPYMMEYPYKCTEQIFNRFYANALASHVANSNPKIQRVFDQWKGTDAMLSNLSKNQELKSVLLEETPWVLDAQSEEEQKRNIALLFDLNKMGNEKAKAIASLKERQLSNGGFSWFPGGRDSWYITQYLVEGFGHLEKMGVTQSGSIETQVLHDAVKYIDGEIIRYYNELKRRRGVKMDEDHLSRMAVHYLYARSFYPQVRKQNGLEPVMDYFINQAEKYWINKGTYLQGMIALSALRDGNRDLAQKIVKSLDENSMKNEELGMYWNYQRGWFWYQHPIETQALMIELFSEMGRGEEVDEMRIWLLKNKQTNRWKTTKATSAAVYGLLVNGSNWFDDNGLVEVSLANKKIAIDASQVEVGTGYFKETWMKDEVKENFAKITVKNPNDHIAWGAAYWQYFEDLDKIKTFEETPLTMTRELTKEVDTDQGKELVNLNDGAQLKQGDKVKVKIILKVDRDMEFVHMKDMRAAGLEPMNPLSSYKWQGGLGYYESAKDLATHFFFDRLPKGTYVFEYPLRATHAGTYSNGISSIQCMYAPEFSSHSEGIKIEIQ